MKKSYHYLFISGLVLGGVMSNTHVVQAEEFAAATTSEVVTDTSIPSNQQVTEAEEVSVPPTTAIATESAYEEEPVSTESTSTVMTTSSLISDATNRTIAANEAEEVSIPPTTAIATESAYEEEPVSTESTSTVMTTSSLISDATNRTIAANATNTSSTSSDSANFETNLEFSDVTEKEGWQVVNDGLYSNAIDKGDHFLYSQTTGEDFVYSADITFLKDQGAGALIFRGDQNTDVKNAYAVNLDASNHKAKMWRWDDNQDYQLIDEKDIVPTEDKKYHLKVVALDTWLSYYINDQLIASTGDYILQRDDKGQDTFIQEGYLGLLNWNGEMIFQNVRYTPLTDDSSPLIEDIVVTSDGTVEAKGQFFEEEPAHIQYVKHDADHISIKVSPKSTAAQITIKDANGTIYSDFSDIPLNVGANYLTVNSQVVQPDGTVAEVSYQLNVHRRQSDDIYYNELFRDQFHYSVEDGWGNDPNGLVYYNGTYHFFYQFYDDNKWGPMHWEHATSKDLITWEEQPIAFYPDANGTMFSGAMVIDEKNTSGLFPDGQGGLVALITANGNGQRIKLAYSTDEGKTWTKSDKIAADWSDDPLESKDFRDPKVFLWENQWFMVIAGGPLRIYSSDNLLDWKVESTYADLHTECPDLYPIETESGELKWVLSRGGRSYKVGDFKQVDNKWTYIPDADYLKEDGVMNFGKDSYAAMTYYLQDFGTATNPTIPQLTEINWMNTWDYCNLVGDALGQAFNGTYNLNLNLGLKKDGSKYVLTQTPIQAYEGLRLLDESIVKQNVLVAQDNQLFADFKGDVYEIVSTFRPSADTKKVGFNLRVGDGEQTKVYYDLETEKLVLDRSQSGVILNNAFAEINSQTVKRHDDGSIELHIFVDRASVEVFAQGNTVAGANQIFPAPTSNGLSVLIEGAAAEAEIALYPLSSIWSEKQVVTDPIDIISLSKATNRLNIGDELELKAYIMPGDVAQDVIWTVDDASLVQLQAQGNRVVLRGLKSGRATVIVTSQSDPTLSKTFTVNILEDQFKTNLDDLVAVSGDWYRDGESLIVSNTGANDYYMTSQPVAESDYSLDLDVKYERGLVNIFFASENKDPRMAYSLQFGGNDQIRLYRFMGDTIAEAPMASPINDNKLHHVKLVKSGENLSVLVDEVEYMSYTFDQLEPFYQEAPYVGVGLWDGEIAIQNLLITYAKDAESNDNSPIVDSSTEAPQLPTANAPQVPAVPTATTSQGTVSPVSENNSITHGTEILAHSNSLDVENNSNNMTQYGIQTYIYQHGSLEYNQTEMKLNQSSENTLPQTGDSKAKLQDRVGEMKLNKSSESTLPQTGDSKAKLQGRVGLVLLFFASLLGLQISQKKSKKW